MFPCVTAARSAATMLIAVFVVAGCSSSAGGQPSAERPATSVPTVATAVAEQEVPVPTTSTPPVEPSAGTDAGDDSSGLEGDRLTDDGVLAAAVLIMSDGDLEAAIREGLITEAEADAALAALESGTLSDYVTP